MNVTGGNQTSTGERLEAMRSESRTKPGGRVTITEPSLRFARPGRAPT